MPATLLKPESRLRIVSRRSSRTTVTVSIRPARPSLLDYRLRGDPWILAHGDLTAGVFFDSCPLLTLSALPLDAAALNSQLHDLRNRRPRPRR
jgi:hypothetical protein